MSQVNLTNPDIVFVIDTVNKRNRLARRRTCLRSKVYRAKEQIMMQNKFNQEKKLIKIAETNPGNSKKLAKIKKIAASLKKEATQKRVVSQACSAVLEKEAEAIINAAREAARDLDRNHFYYKRAREQLPQKIKDGKVPYGELKTKLLEAEMHFAQVNYELHMLTQATTSRMRSLCKKLNIKLVWGQNNNIKSIILSDNRRMMASEIEHIATTNELVAALDI